MTDIPHRIAFCITELDPGGAERALVRIVTGLDRSLWEPRVYCLAESGSLAEPLEAAGVTVHSLGVRSKTDVGVISRLKRELTAFQPDVLQTFLFHANIVGRLAAWRAKVPIVVSGVRVIEADATWRMRFDKWTNRLVTHNVCVSRSVAERYRRMGFVVEKLSAIGNGVNVADFDAAPPADLGMFGIPRDARTLLSVGRLHPQKGFDQLIDAVGPLLDEQPELHLLIVGEGPERDALQSQCRTFTHGERIHLVGRRDDVPSLMKASDLFVLSSRWEGMPNVVLEAMAAGLPVVANDVEGVSELVVDGVTGRIVTRKSTPSESVSALRAAIEDVLQDPALKARGTEGRLRVEEHFTWPSVVQAYEKLWTELINQRDESS